jgi:hypothetical protein
MDMISVGDNQLSIFIKCAKKNVSHWFLAHRGSIGGSRKIEKKSRRIILMSSRNALNRWTLFP